MTKRKQELLLNISIEAEIRRFVKVRAYRRIRFGKVERIKSYYRQDVSSVE